MNRQVFYSWCLTALLTSNIQAKAMDDKTTKGSSGAAHDEKVIQVFASRISATANEIPASISVIDKEQIEKIMPNKLSDLLRYEAGVTVESSGHRHSDAGINIRGIGGNRVLMVKDGVLLPDGFGSAGVSQGRGSFDPFNLNHVEILKGPASALYGSNALGGVVLVNTADPKVLYENNDNQAYVSLNTGYFSEDSRTRLGIATATKIGAGHGLFQAQTQLFEDIDVNSDFIVNPKEGDSDSVFFKWVYEGEKQKIVLTAEHYQQTAENILNTNIRPIAGPPGTAITEALADDESTRQHLGIRHELYDLSWSDKVQWQVDYQVSNYKQYEHERTQNPGMVISPIPTSDKVVEEWEDFEQKQLSFSLLLENEFEEQHLLIGLEGHSKSIERPVDKRLTDNIAGTTTNIINGIVHPGKTFPDADVLKLGFFIQDHITIKEYLKVIAGLRYDYFKNSPKPDRSYQNFNLANAQPLGYDDKQVSPHLGMVFDMTEQASFYANYSTGYRTPPIAEQYISRSILIPVPGVPHEVIPNNQLESETSEGIEVGLRWSDDNYHISLAAYQNNYEDFIDSRTIGYRSMPPLFTGATAIRQIQYQNVDEVEIKGIELNGTVVIDSLLPNGWHGDFNFSANHIKGNNKQTGVGLNSIPPNNLVLGFTLQPTDSWQFSWHARAVDKADDVEPLVHHGQPLPAFEPPSYQIFDMNAIWNISEELALNFSVYNLSDEKYWAAHNKGDNANADLDAKVAPGRNFAVSASYQF
ncbi:TonB-dependent hemoglobin/transferrin/lactoferrin family receptor [Aliikangiella sp. IMCC44359]|uniref:TonB-dependent hemoglobin/transferrin/lactoferrin family receptor n=1 Tax=Aliikangiella sp. IMCC44359 TaxID=3459125 RepID=UPI00403B061F